MAADMSISCSNPLLTSDEYERRKYFVETLKGLTKAEYIEIVRILQKHEVTFSENANGIFFNVAGLTQDVFDALALFIRFTESNRRDLAEREHEMDRLAKESRKLEEKLETA